MANECADCGGEGTMQVTDPKGRKIDIKCPSCKGQPHVHPAIGRALDKFEEVFDGIFGPPGEDDSE